MLSRIRSSPLHNGTEERTGLWGEVKQPTRRHLTLARQYGYTFAMLYTTHTTYFSSMVMQSPSQDRLRELLHRA